MKVRNFLTLSLVSLSLAFTACQNAKTNPAADFKSLENAVPPGDKPVLRQDGVEALYLIKPSGAFAFTANESKSIRFQVSVIKGINYNVQGSSMPEGMTITAIDLAKGEYAVNWKPTNQILAMEGNKGTFNIHVIPNKSSDQAVLSKWIKANYIEHKEFAWTATKVSKLSSSATTQAKVTTEAPAPVPLMKIGKIETVGETSVIFKAGEDEARFITLKGSNGILKIDTEKINRVDFSALPGKPTITCNEVAKQTFVQECKIFWSAPCTVKDQYSFKIPYAVSLNNQKSESTFEYVIKFDKKTNACKPAAKSVGKSK